MHWLASKSSVNCRTGMNESPVVRRHPVRGEPLKMRQRGVSDVALPHVIGIPPGQAHMIRSRVTLAMIDAQAMV